MKNEETVRLNKAISETGFCSRREADKLIEANKVTKLDSSRTNHLFDISEYSIVNLDVRFAEEIV